ncbi:MAG: NAD-dependent epimerase/dehydratase family protein [Betaproteobacteria bacterium]
MSLAYSSEMRIVVTGASGFIGRTLCPALAAAGHEPLPVSLVSIRDVPPFEGTDAVVHLAAIAHRRRTNLNEIHRVNVHLAERVGRAAAVAGTRMIFLSSVKVHGEESAAPLREHSPIAPQDGYGESKARAEDALRSIPGLRLTVLRPPLVYGPGVRANFLALMRAVARGLPLPLASVANRRSLVYVGNLADAILRCLERNAVGAYLVSDGAPMSTPELCRELGAALGRPARLFPFPAPLLPRKLAASLEVDDSAIRRALGWQPLFSREAGLRATAQWYRGRR